MINAQEAIDVGSRVLKGNNLIQLAPNLGFEARGSNQDKVINIYDYLGAVLWVIEKTWRPVQGNKTTL